MVDEYERRLGRKEAAQFLTDQGYKTAPATLARLACIGGGPQFFKLRAPPALPRGGLAGLGARADDRAAAVYE